MALVTVVAYDRAACGAAVPPHHISAEQMSRAAKAVFGAVGLAVYGFEASEVPADHVSVQTSWAQQGSHSGYSLEFTVWVASDDRPHNSTSGEGIDCMDTLEKWAQDLGTALEHAVGEGLPFNVWIQATQTAFWSGVGTSPH